MSAELSKHVNSLSDHAAFHAIIDDISIESLRSRYSDLSCDPLQVIRSVYSKIVNHPDKAVWITLIPEIQALAATEALMQKHPNPDQRPPLYGIPFSVKDSIDIASLPTTLACPSYAYTATETAPVVQRILDAGGILIGKTNLDQFATGLNGTRSPYGTPRCVRDADYVSGGSSSGSAVSVAAGLVSFTVATDTAGSTRVPAALNGLVGLKPTLGTISTVGLVPACKTADCICIIAKTVYSTIAAWEVMRGYDSNDTYARDPLQLSVLAQQPSWPTSNYSQPILYGLPSPSLISSTLSPYYSIIWSKIVSRLSSLSLVQSSSFTYSPFATANDLLYGSSIVSQRIVAFKPYLEKQGYSQLHPVIASIFRASDGFTAVQAFEDIFALQTLKRQAHSQFRSQYQSEGIDVLIVPSTALHPTVEEMLADPIDLNKRQGGFTHFVNLLDLCAVSVPAGGNWVSKNGNSMPFGVTLISLPGRDLELLSLGKRLMDLDWM